jgi:hypothetical protein
MRAALDVCVKIVRHVGTIIAACKPKAGGTPAGRTYTTPTPTQYAI